MSHLTLEQLLFQDIPRRGIRTSYTVAKSAKTRDAVINLQPSSKGGMKLSLPALLLEEFSQRLQVRQAPVDFGCILGRSRSCHGVAKYEGISHESSI